jgi:hypothetical protein
MLVFFTMLNFNCITTHIQISDSNFNFLNVAYSSTLKMEAIYSSRTSAVSELHGGTTQKAVLIS